MNLTQLFNLKFFLQNLKKSKASIIFMLLLLPAFTAISLIAYDREEAYVLDFAEASVFNIIFMYIVPIAISLTLFSFCFKKTSCDFIGSMPVSRKSLFTTNTIGGICLIVIMQLITALLTLIYSATTTKLIIFCAMIWDMFLFFTIAYIFVFIVCNLAISISGNKFAAIATTLLILFLVPFTIACSRINNNIYNSYGYYENEYQFTYYNTYHFTAPSMLFDEQIFSGNGPVYDSISIIKMVVLSVIYFIIGIKLFNRKKYEVAGESFENEKVHLLVKMLTLSPFAAFASLVGIENMDAFFLFFIAFVMIYYYLFDMITNKKVKLKITIATFFASCFIMYAFYYIVVPRLGFIGMDQIKVAEIESLTIENVKCSYKGINIFNLTIDDKELIEKVLSFNNNDYSPFSSNFYYDSAAEGFAKTTNGRIHKINIRNLLKIDAFAQAYGDNIFSFNDDNGKVMLTGIKASKEFEKELKSSLKKDLDGITYKDYINILKSQVEDYELLLVDYKNHKIVKQEFSYENLRETRNCAIKELNKNAYKSNATYWNMSKSVDFAKYIIVNNPQITFSDDYEYEGYEEYLNEVVYERFGEEKVLATPEKVYYDDPSVDYDYNHSTEKIIYSGLRSFSLTQMKNYLKEHKDDSFDSSKPYFAIQCIGRGVESVFYSNDLEGFYKLFSKIYNESLSNESGIKLNEI